jgi:hypothetical protein
MASRKTEKLKPAVRSQRFKEHRRLLANVVKAKGSGRVVAEELTAQGVKCSQQSVSAWLKGEWPPRPATQAVLKRLYNIPATWGAT